ncbi:bifunctional sugar phosphate isomerase/epimerase/4-hydroxyphenylpyruvate dioxygenase family protein [Neoroseomonas oryzicola]|uniref:3-dehydroshikimate dehydratase n=1 Tax=Neoroseomonas oryzicola TaxID=535904 RepID=A0A9X9WHJ8_9PROT|nr:sugar phosphate isomerase/epimerase and 4-hydroxyphenylpyruvate domain-containing protein [Neoroseomonas oryzicola]MBR0659808.1 sugar phosphate isomerase/epimerase and 4-hydroxyphenylpyruvate domain-containing protein [Neoroseomonas oryzicola]NKE19818.1 sugar phosphate isomerase/epimerase and 4-hydroxyphenylpyruvate domain-containing protein [Neoroseomonas oryzicola]
MAAPGRLPKSIATVCLSGALPDKLEAASAAGFEAVEIFENDLLTFDGTAADVRRMCEDLDLAVSIFQPFRDFEAMPEPQRTRNVDRAERKFDTMQALGTDLVLVCSNVQAAALDDPSRAAADLREMAERAARRGLRVCYEALAWGRHVNRWRQAWDIVRRADHPALGLCLDSFHTLSVGDDLAGIGVVVPPEKVFFLQLADAPRLAMDPLSWSRHHRLFPGQGELDVARFLRDLLGTGWAGMLSLEIFNDEFRAAPSRRIARDGLRSLIWLEDQVRRAPLPDLPRLSGIEFVEFAVDPAARNELGRFLGGLGFAKAGLHRSKDVELWRSGAANLVLNAEPDSAAAERFEQLGPTVCAMALRVDDPERVVARAEALQYPVWRERIGEGERRIPAVRQPDGTLVYLVEDPSQGAQPIWEDDFSLSPIADGPAAPLGVDHAAQAVAPGMMDSFVLFYRAVFGLQPEALWELPDPYGLVRSRAFVAPNGSVRLPLNVSESTRTGTGRFVSALAGAGVHHIAFAVPDAGAAADAAAARGAPMLDIPENYYEDLAARLGLGDAELHALQQRHLLYDQDAAGGVFRHAYTRQFRDRIFLEIAERSGGYTGFGAVNAPVRMAAQRRNARQGIGSVPSD